MNKQDERLLLTPEEKGKIRAKIPGTTNVIDFAREVSDRTAKAQLAKVKPILIKRGFDEGVKKTMDAADSTFSAQLEEAKREERERIFKWVEEHGTFEGRGAGTMTMKVMKWWWQALLPKTSSTKSILRGEK